jgi:hypothetical protein
MARLAEISPAELQPAVHSALRAWHSPGSATLDLLDALLLVQENLQLDGQRPSPTTGRLAINRVLLAAIEALEAQDQTGGRVLRLRFADNNTLLMAANKLNVTEHTISRVQRKAIGRLAEIIYEQERDARETRANAIETQMPPSTYTRLFGFDDAQSQLLEQLRAEDKPWVVAVVGIGGIGKTALADAVVRRSIREFQFDSAIWLRSEPQTMSGRSISPQHTFENLIADLAEQIGLDSTAASADQTLSWVRQKLKVSSYLIVVDNIETAPETAFLLDHLNDLAQPSKFLLTTRTRPAPQATVYHFPVNELSQGDALSLLIYHAQDIGITALEYSSESDLRAIYELTGGNPLALKLVVSLLDLQPLPRIVEALMRSRPGPIEDMYRHVYWQTWQTLSPPARSLLQVMPLVAETGALPDYLQSLSNLTDDQLWPAFQELRSRSLLEVRGTLQEKRYGIHRLTETFLRTEIINWLEDQSARGAGGL